VWKLAPQRRLVSIVFTFGLGALVRLEVFYLFTSFSLGNLWGVVRQWGMDGMGVGIIWTLLLLLLLLVGGEPDMATGDGRMR
jgi:hypothetical protein